MAVTPDEKRFMRRLGRRFKELRLEAEVSQTDMGVAMGYGRERKSVSDIERGELRLSLYRAIKAAEYLEIPVEELWES